MKILIVEDTDDSRILMERTLASQGYEVMSASNGVEALELALSIPPDLIISDIMMPEMDGFDLCRRIKSDPVLKSTPLVFYTAIYTDAQDEKLAMDVGASRLVAKPVAPDKFIKIVEDVLAAHKAQVLRVPEAPMGNNMELDARHLKSVADKLDKKVRELEDERHALKESEAKYRRLVESLQEYYFFFTHDTGGEFIYLSPSISNVLGYTPDEFHDHFQEYLTDNPVNNVVKRYVELSIQGEKQPPYEIEILHKDGSIKWLEVKEIPILDRHGQVIAVEGIAQDITERKSHEKMLNLVLTQTIQAISVTVEKRDPYTAGHQRRVAGLASAIGKEMKLDEQRIEGILMGATIHDIGKIYIPAEILSRPGKLSEIEFMLIKNHTQVGYEIVRDVDFPWPVSEMIHQHHERMDGSGYGKGLKGNEIILEARILTVSDVVEAMASHRPYRAGLGIETALAEIKKNKGRFYDSDVVDACLKLFNEKGYSLG